ncbi:hypothetical protein Y032_0064g3518 [Ancylostoma ceylanicum]|uniref:Transmembrane protein n=1 Tax=Ancylostoma ceylanicum TaxID=53326 RepID=A0A016U0Y0_9BILA|nr:hypothetical protein Y032_0064g3518 [Ancylostoma ceylanicum]
MQELPSFAALKNPNYCYCHVTIRLHLFNLAYFPINIAVLFAHLPILVLTCTFFFCFKIPKQALAERP